MFKPGDRVAALIYKRDRAWYGANYICDVSPEEIEQGYRYGYNILLDDGVEYWVKPSDVKSIKSVSFDFIRDFIMYLNKYSKKYILDGVAALGILFDKTVRDFVLRFDSIDYSCADFEQILNDFCDKNCCIYNIEVTVNSLIRRYSINVYGVSILNIYISLNYKKDKKCVEFNTPYGPIQLYTISSLFNNARCRYSKLPNINDLFVMFYLLTFDKSRTLIASSDLQEFDSMTCSFKSVINNYYDDTWKNWFEETLIVLDKVKNLHIAE